MEHFLQVASSFGPASNTDDVIGALSEINKILILADILSQEYLMMLIFS